MDTLTARRAILDKAICDQLAAHPAGMSAATLAGRTGFTPPAVNQALNRLYSRGTVEHVPPRNPTTAPPLRYRLVRSG